MLEPSWSLTGRGYPPLEPRAASPQVPLHRKKHLPWQRLARALQRRFSEQFGPSYVNKHLFFAQNLVFPLYEL
jgi:hypothetical protein